MAAPAVESTLTDVDRKSCIIGKTLCNFINCVVHATHITLEPYESQLTNTIAPSPGRPYSCRSTACAGRKACFLRTRRKLSGRPGWPARRLHSEIGRASGRERVCQYV